MFFIFSSSAIQEAEEKRLRKEFEMAVKPVFPNLESEVSDSNIITPGTVFMDKLSKALKSYVNQRIESDAGWKEIKVEYITLLPIFLETIFICLPN